MTKLLASLCAALSRQGQLIDELYRRVIGAAGGRLKRVCLADASTRFRSSSPGLKCGKYFFASRNRITAFRVVPGSCRMAVQTEPSEATIFDSITLGQRVHDGELPSPVVDDSCLWSFARPGG
jgi:hypothetical protein